MTPFEIDILIHYATTRVDHPMMSSPPPIWRETMNRFLSEGLLLSGGEGADVAYVATERLKVYVEALQQVPEGWQFVPIEPTPKMGMAIYEAMQHLCNPKSAAQAWSDALLSAPKPQEPVQAVVQAVIAERDAFDTLPDDYETGDY